MYKVFYNLLNWVYWNKWKICFNGYDGSKCCKNKYKIFFLIDLFIIILCIIICIYKLKGLEMCFNGELCFIVIV